MYVSVEMQHMQQRALQALNPKPPGKTKQVCPDTDHPDCSKLSVVA